MSFPNSKRIYINGTLHPNLRIPLREISLADTTHPDGRVEIAAELGPDAR